MTGHKTRSVFERYNIVSDGDLRDAARNSTSPLWVRGRVRQDRGGLRKPLKDEPFDEGDAAPHHGNIDLGPA